MPWQSLARSSRFIRSTSLAFGGAPTWVRLKWLMVFLLADYRMYVDVLLFRWVKIILRPIAAVGQQNFNLLS